MENIFFQIDHGKGYGFVNNMLVYNNSSLKPYY